MWDNLPTIDGSRSGKEGSWNNINQILEGLEEACPEGVELVDYYDILDSSEVVNFLEEWALSEDDVYKQLQEMERYRLGQDYRTYFYSREEESKKYGCDVVEEFVMVVEDIMSGDVVAKYTEREHRDESQ